MPISPDLSFQRILPNTMFDRLGELLQQIAKAVGKTALILTEDILAPINIPNEWQRRRFTVVVSKQFSALLLGLPSPTENSLNGSSPHTSDFTFGYISNGQVPSQCESKISHVFASSLPLDSLLNCHLTFHSETIASFVSSLKDLFNRNSHTYQQLEYYRQIPVSNDATLQSQFTLLLLNFFIPESNQEVTELPQAYPSVSVCQPVESALKKQVVQEKLLNQVTNQIRKSLDLPVIMATAVAQVREFLELDRLVVYKFEHSTVNSHQSSVISHPSQQELPQRSGCIVYEVLKSNVIPSVLNYKEENCFRRATQCWEKYSQGFTLAVDDIEKVYTLEECLLNFLREAKVRAKLTAPIIFEEKLWGLLIAHQCDRPRAWTDSEEKLLTSVAEQLAIAIHQAELMRSLRQEKQYLEDRVIDRTVALHDALVAAEAASRLKSEFLATISHELLTPLTYVIGMSSTLLRWSFGELTKRQRDYLQTIHDSGEHLLEMINDILELSQIEAGKAVLNITEFSLIEIAESAIHRLNEKAIIKRVNLILDLQINPQHDRFTADARRVQQILGNLLSNAVKFTPEGGNITLRLWVEDNSAVFLVEDTGIGIPEEQLPLLFEKFHQLDTPLRRRYGGTGLGLALTKQLIELHRGRIEVESTVGVGSVFTVWIPTTRE